MPRKDLSRVAYSFSRQNHRNQPNKNDNSCQEIQTNEQSDTSEFRQFNQQTNTTHNFSTFVKSLTQQNQYYREALKTAETLITNYQKENSNLKEENAHLNSELVSLNAKLQNLQRLLFKLFQCQKSTSPPQQNSKSSFYQMGKQNLNSYYNADDEFQHRNIELKISKIIHQQLTYEEQIFQLNKKIQFLQKMHNSDIKDLKQAQKNKFKTSIYIPYTQTEAFNEEKVRMANHLVQLYGNQKTIKAVPTKQSDFKKNLQKEFSVFLQSKRSTTKSKSSILKTPCSNNNRSSHNISISTQKKNCQCRKSSSIQNRKSSSIPKR